MTLLTTCPVVPLDRSIHQTVIRWQRSSVLSRKRSSGLSNRSSVLRHSPSSDTVRPQQEPSPLPRTYDGVEQEIQQL